MTNPVIERKRRMRVYSSIAQFGTMLAAPHPLGLSLRDFVPPRDVHTAVTGSDVEGDAALLWMLTRLLAPQLVVELGVRHGMTTRVLCSAMPEQATGYFVDPNPACRNSLPVLLLADPLRHFVPALGETVWANSTGKFDSRIDLLMVDTDPHTYEQTRGWLDTFVAEGLAPGGVAVFHDVRAARPEIKVKEAVEDWLVEGPEHRVGWDWHVFPSLPGMYRYGLGLLWKPL